MTWGRRNPSTLPHGAPVRYCRQSRLNIARNIIQVIEAGGHAYPPEPPQAPPVFVPRLPASAEGYGIFGKQYHGD